MQKRIVFLLAVWLLVVPGTESAISQQAQKQTESFKYRTIFTIAGGGGGFMLGLGAGLAAYDDATYASRKVWTVSVIGAAAGAVGGYFIGRALDKRKTPPPIAWAPDESVRERIRARMAAETEKFLRDRSYRNPDSLPKIQVGGKPLSACQVANFKATIGESDLSRNR